MAAGLTTDEMKSFVRQHFEDFVNNKKAEVIQQNMTPGFYDHDGPGNKPAGIAADEQMMRNMYALIPDLRIEIEEMIAEGDMVVCRNRWSGTNSQTHKPMGFHGFVQWRFEDGKIAERWATVTPPAELPG